MFTGIVQELGEVVRLDRYGDGAVIAVRAPTVAGGCVPGDSVAVDGACLTVVQAGDGTFSADVMKETLARTTLDAFVPGAAVNVEPAATAATRLGGHIVQGHVDGVGTVLSRAGGERWHDVSVALPPELARYVVEKGSVAVDGVSLTVVSVADDPPVFTVSLVPTTLERTTLGLRAVGEPVNLEVDVIAKYVEKLVARVPR